MRKTIILGTLIALLGIGASAQAKEPTATEPKSTVEASQPETSAPRGEGKVRELRSVANAERGNERDNGREHHGKTHQHYDEDREHGRHR